MSDRNKHVLLLLITIGLGLLSRRFPESLPDIVARYAGDVLWASMVVWGLRLLSPRVATTRIALAAFTIAVVVEASQLYRAPWIDAIRATRAGALALGQGFLWSDLACYAVGVVLAGAIDRALPRCAVPAPNGNS